jgi:hypothetical protein
MSGIGKDILVYVEADAATSDQIGAFLKVQGGTVLTRTTSGAKEALDVYPVSTFAEDLGHTTGALGQFILGVRNDANTVLTSTDLDYSPIATDSAGRLKVVATLTINTEYAEDSVAANLAVGSYVLAVRKDADTGSLVDNGDYASFTVDAVDRLKINAVGNVADSAADGGFPVKIGYRAQTGALVSTTIADNDRVDAISDEFRRVYINDSPNIGVASATTTVNDTVGGTLVPATALVGRRRLIIENIGTKNIFVGKSGTITAANGLRISPSSTLALEIGDDVTIAAITSAGLSAEVRTLELA